MQNDAREGKNSKFSARIHQNSPKVCKIVQKHASVQKHALLRLLGVENKTNRNENHKLKEGEGKEENRFGCAKKGELSGENKRIMLLMAVLLVGEFVWLVWFALTSLFRFISFWFTRYIGLKLLFRNVFFFGAPAFSAAGGRSLLHQTNPGQPESYLGVKASTLRRGSVLWAQR